MARRRKNRGYRRRSNGPRREAKFLNQLCGDRL